jgi:hypothetical protein
MRAFLHPANPGYATSRSRISQKAGIPLKAASTIRQIRDQISASSPNVGNLIHNEAIAKTFLFDTQLSAMGSIEHLYRVECSSNERRFKEKLSSNFDAVVFSYANMVAPPLAGREDSQRKHFSALTEIVHSINLPFYVFGVGMQNRLSSQHDILPELLEFLQELNRKAHIFGCRGAETEAFLKRIGCDRAQALGCPSLYVFPNEIRSIEPVFDVFNKRGMTAGYLDRKHLLGYQEDRIRSLEKISSKLDLSYVFQNDLLTLTELEDVPNLFRDADNSCDEQTINPYIESFGYKIDINQYYFFRDSRSWRQYAKSRDYFFGDRFHGGVVSLQTGRPALFVFNDVRVQELTEHFGLPSVSLSGVIESDLGDVLEAAFGKDSITKMQDIYADKFQEYMGVVTKAGLSPLTGIYEKPRKRPEIDAGVLARIDPLCDNSFVGSKITAARKLAVLGGWTLASIERLVSVLLMEGRFDEVQAIIELSIRQTEFEAEDEALVFRFSRLFARFGAVEPCQCIIKRYLDAETAIWSSRIVIIMIDILLRSDNLMGAEHYFASAQQKKCFNATDANAIQEKLSYRLAT